MRTFVELLNTEAACHEKMIIFDCRGIRGRAEVLRAARERIAPPVLCPSALSRDRKPEPTGAGEGDGDRVGDVGRAGEFGQA